MKRPFAAAVRREGKRYVSQRLELDVASPGETEEEALTNLKEAIELHFEPLLATRPPAVPVGTLRRLAD
jgi:predicted RNase H-like HicB family nuclease